MASSTYHCAFRVLIAILALSINTAFACGDLKDPFDVKAPDDCAPNCAGTWNEYDPETGNGLFVAQGYISHGAQQADSCEAAINVDRRVRVTAVRIVDNETGRIIEDFGVFRFDLDMTRRLSALDWRTVFWAFRSETRNPIKPEMPLRLEFDYTAPTDLSRISVAKLFNEADIVTGMLDETGSEWADHATVANLGVTHVCFEGISLESGKCR